MADPTPFVLGLTGGIGAGKSTCTARIAQSGIKVFDCDAEVAALYDDPGFVRDLERGFGPLGDTPKRALMLKVLEHPAVLDLIYMVAEDRLDARWEAFLAENREAPLVVIDAPLLIEKGWDRRCAAVMCVFTEREERLRRVLARPGMTEAWFDAIATRQTDDMTRMERTRFIIDGNGALEDTLTQVDGALSAVIALAYQRYQEARGETGGALPAV